MDVEEDLCNAFEGPRFPKKAPTPEVALKLRCACTEPLVVALKFSPR